LRTSESNATHLQVNRPLFDEFTTVLAAEEWDIALLQEAPPRWHGELCRRLGASGALVLTSRNWGAGVRARIANWNPDLIASNEGGSNQVLVRPPWRIAGTRRLTLTRRPERRAALWVRVERDGSPGLAVVNLHASADLPNAAAREVLRAAEWAADGPLLFGGDLNLRPASEPQVFSELEERFGLAPSTAPDAIDHLLARGLDVVEPPHQLPAERRELEADGRLRIRLSDHAIAAARFAVK
jgi:endonuclease/exonuclease/phosphatase family metal-dependent hydrolase